MGRDEELKLVSEAVRGRRCAVVTGPAAARVRGLGTRRWVTSVDLVLRGRTNAKAGRPGKSVRVRSYSLPDEFVEVIDGIPVTSLILTLLDTYRYYGRVDCLVTLEDARRKQPSLTQEHLLWLASTLGPAHGIRGLRDLITYSTHLTESVFETCARDKVIRARIPGVRTVVPQARVNYISLDGTPRAGRVDLLINDIIVIECDGRQYHTREIEPEERHREKQLFNQGYFVIRIGWRDLDRLPQLVEQALRRIEHAGAAISGARGKTVRRK